MLRDSTNWPNLKIRFENNWSTHSQLSEGAKSNIFGNGPPLAVLLLLPSIAYKIAEQLNQSRMNQLTFNGMSKLSFTISVIITNLMKLYFF